MLMVLIRRGLGEHYIFLYVGNVHLYFNLGQYSFWLFLGSV